LGYTRRVTHAPVAIRPAATGDLAEILHLFADDDLPGSDQPHFDAVMGAHRAALETIDADPNNHVYVAELDGVAVGTFQLTFIRQLSYGGCLVARVESVHVHSSVRSRGVGEQMMRFARAEAERRGALRLELTSNLRRERAHRFYERLGFRTTHKGMKLYLEPPHRARTTER
jgi:GNAT superfamily N-acetyltransferase